MDTCKRAEEFKELAKKAGIQIKEQYWCLGAYNTLVIYEAPDAETVTAVMLSLNMRGNVTTQTLRAFTAAEMSKILEKVE
jgi:uncharacterized protein with GYD domain